MILLEHEPVFWVIIPTSVNNYFWGPFSKALNNALHCRGMWLSMVGYYQIVEKGVVENTLLHSVVENTLLHSKPLSKPPLDKQECSSFKVKSEMVKRNLQSIVLRSTTVYSNSIIFYFDYIMSLDLFGSSFGKPLYVQQYCWNPFKL